MKIPSLDDSGKLPEKFLRVAEQIVRPASYYGIKSDGSTNNAAAFADMYGDLVERGGDVQMQPGITYTSVPVVVPGSSRLVGVGMSYTSQPYRDFPELGSIIRPIPGSTGWTGRGLVELVGGVGGSDTSNVSSSLRDVITDAAGVADWALVTSARRNHVHNLYAMRGKVGGVKWYGQNGLMDGFSVVDQQGVGDCILVNGGDNKFLGHIQPRGFGATGAGIHIIGGGDIQIRDIHSWVGANGESGPGWAEIWIDSTNTGLQNINIQGCALDGINGPQVRITAGAGKIVSHVTINGNTFFIPGAGGIADNQVDAILLDGDGSIETLTIGQNTAKGANAALRYRAFLHDAGSATAQRSQIAMDNNVGESCMHPMLVEPAVATAFNSAFEPGVNIFHDGAISRRTSDSGTATLTGDGVKSTFYITTHLDAAAKNWQVTPANAAAAAASYYVSATIGNVLAVTFVDAAGAAVAPVNGASISLSWRATSKPTVPATVPALGADFVTDTFTGTAGTSLNAHTGEAGATWSFYGSDLLKISSTNTLHVTATSTTRALYLASGAPASADYAVKADVTIKSNITSEVIGPALRSSAVNSSDVSAYALVHVGSTGGSWRLVRLSHVAAGAGTTLVTVNGYTGVGETHTALLTVQGPFLTAYLDGVQVAQVFDTTIAGTGKPGINWSGVSAASDTTGAHLDNFHAAPLA